MVMKELVFGLLGEYRKLFILLLIVFCVHLGLNTLIYWHRIVLIYTHYGLLGVDTDSTLWNQAMQIFSDGLSINRQHTQLLVAFPYGYNLAKLPFYSLIFEINIAVMKLLGGGWQNLVFVSNVSTLLAHPLTGVTSFALAYYLIKDKYAAFFSSCIFTYSYYYIVMSAGSLSLDHYELIPLYLLSVFYLVNRPSLVRILISCVIFSLTFMANPYWAFFSGICSIPIMMMGMKGTLTRRLQLIFFYYLSLGLILLLTNVNYVYQQAYNLDKSALITSGKVDSPLDKLLPIHYFFFHPQYSSLFGMGTRGGYYLGYVSILCGFVGLIVIGLRNRFILICIIIISLAILTTSYIPPLFLYNELYFKYFSMFRSVSRINIFATLFMGILSAYMVKQLCAKYCTIHKKHITRYLFILLSVLVILEGLTTSPEFWQTTDFSRIQQFFLPIANNPVIHSIASYPARLSDGDTGFPMRIDLLGQIVHKKPLAMGADPFDKITLAHSRAIKDIEKPRTIDYLREHFIDTIIVYDHLIGSNSLSNMLMKDPRLKFIGSYQSQSITHEKSQNEWSMSVFSILGAKPLTYTPPSNKKVVLTKHSPYHYSFAILAPGQNTISINEPGVSDWRIYKDNNADPMSIATSKQASQATRVSDGLFATWIVHQVKSGDKFDLYYYPWLIASIGTKIQYVTFGLIAIIIFIAKILTIRRGKISKIP